MEISTELGDDMVKIMSGADQSKISSSMKFIWEEKQKYLKSSSAGIRHHPVIFRYCLSPAAKSSGAYDETRCDEKRYWCLNSPKLLSLRDYKNYVKPERGFNPNIML